MKRHLYAMLVGLLILSACSNEESLITETISEPDSGSTFMITAGMPEGTTATRLNLTEQGSTGSEYLKVQWTSTTDETAKDKFSVFAGSGATSSIPLTWDSMVAGSDDQIANFIGMTPDANTDYYGFYPVTESTSTSGVPLDMRTGQKGELNPQKVYMYSGKSKLSRGKLIFNFSHLTSVLKLKMSFYPERLQGGLSDYGVGGTITRLDAGTKIYVGFSANGLLTDETVNITDGSVVSSTKGDIVFENNDNLTLEDGNVADEELKREVYLHLLPAKPLKEFIVTVKIDDSDVYYEGVISDNCTIDEQKYYTAYVEMYKRPIRVGDIMLTNGKIIPPVFYNAPTHAPIIKEKAIGVVAYLYDEDTPDNLRVEFGDANNPTKAKGLVMALKNTAIGKAWSSSTSTTVGSSYQHTYYADAYNGANGYTLLNSIPTTLSLDDYYAIKAAMDYTPAAPTTITTCWYLPSIGEWTYIMSDKGIGGSSEIISKAEAATTESVFHTSDNTKKDICSSLNKYLSGKTISGVEVLTSGTDYDEFSNTSNNWYWSASEDDNNAAFGLGFGSIYSYVGCGKNNKGLTRDDNRVRAILAF